MPPTTANILSAAMTSTRWSHGTDTVVQHSFLSDGSMHIGARAVERADSRASTSPGLAASPMHPSHARAPTPARAGRFRGTLKWMFVHRASHVACLFRLSYERYFSYVGVTKQLREKHSIV